MVLYFIHIPKTGGTSIKLALKNNSNVVCFSHRKSVSKANGESIVVIRNPVDRFKSAVRFAIERYSHTPNLRRIIKAGLVTPDSWVTAMRDKENAHHNLIMKEILNHPNSNNSKHKVDGIILKYSCTYEPQISWIGNNVPTHIIRFENIQDDWKALSHKYKFLPRELPHRKMTRKTQRNNSLSEENKLFLEKFYHQDLKFWKQNMDK